MAEFPRERAQNNSLKLELVTFERRILSDNPTKEVREEEDRQTGVSGCAV